MLPTLTRPDCLPLLQQATFWEAPHWSLGLTRERTVMCQGWKSCIKVKDSMLTVNRGAAFADRNDDVENAVDLVLDALAALEGLVGLALVGEILSRSGACGEIVSRGSSYHGGEGDKGDDVLELHFEGWFLMKTGVSRFGNVVRLEMWFDWKW